MVDTPAATPSGTPEPPASEPARGTPEYNELMATRYDNQRPVETETPATETPALPALPEGGLEKFYNKTTGAYDWSNHVKELNYRLDQNKKPQTPAQPAQTPSATPDPNKPAEAGNSVDWDAAISELSTSGQWSPETISKLEKVVPRALLEGYAQDIALARQAKVHVAMDYAGGEKALNDTLQWAKQSLPPSEIEEYNRLLAGNNWRVALDSLKARRVASDPTAGDPKLVAPTATAGVTNGTGPFANKFEMVDAMSKRDASGRKLYEIDPNYRARVRQRIATSNF